MPTFLEAAGCKTKFKNKIDGVSHWQSLNGQSPAVRQEILHNIDPTKHDTNTNDTRKWKSDWDIQVQAAIRWNEWKLITGDPGSFMMPKPKNKV